MTVADLEKRLSALEKKVEELQARVLPSPAAQRNWWRDDAGRFADDPVFDEIVRLGRQYRESLHPDRRKKKAAKKVRKNAHS
jgi:hypothetical protein